jgi:hypothetical protein
MTVAQLEAEIASVRRQLRDQFDCCPPVATAQVVSSSVPFADLNDRSPADIQREIASIKQSLRALGPDLAAQHHNVVDDKLNAEISAIMAKFKLSFTAVSKQVWVDRIFSALNETSSIL